MATWGKFSPIPHPWTNLEVSTISLMLSYPIFILSNIKILLESKTLAAFAGRTCMYQYKMHENEIE